MTVVRKTYAPPEPNMKEVYRYMGVKGEPDEATRQLADEAVDRIKSSSMCRVCYTRLPIERPDSKTLVIGSIRTESVFLAGNLADCSEVYLFMATIGGGADRLIASSRMYPSKALALDAAASALTEALCNKLNAGRIRRFYTRISEILCGHTELTEKHRRCLKKRHNDVSDQISIGTYRYFR